MVWCGDSTVTRDKRENMTEGDSMVIGEVMMVNSNAIGMMIRKVS